MSAKRVIIFSIVAAVFFFLAILFIQRQGTEENHTEHNPYKDADLTVEIIPAPNNTYGYNILMNGRTLIHQPSVPALPGIEGFKSEEDARRVADFVVSKIQQNIFPPSVSVDELDLLGSFVNN